MFKNTRFLRLLSSRRRRWLLWSAAPVCAYTLFGFLILPLVVRSVAVKQLSARLDREVSIARVRINPYSMSATVGGFLIKDKDGQPFVSWDEMHANLQLSSLFTPAYVFRNIELSRPYLRAQVNPDRSLNFSDILERMAREAARQPKPTKQPKQFALRIDRLKIVGARMSATDLTTRPHFTKVIGPLELTLLNFATDPKSRNPYSFAGTTEEGERFTWSGHFFLDPVRSIGEFTLDNVALVKYAPLYQNLVRFDIRDGIVDLRSSYHVEHLPGTNIARLTNATFAVRSLKVAETGGAESAMEIAHFALAGVSADAFGRIAEIGSINTRDGKVGLRRNADASVNLIELSQPNLAATNTAGSVAVLLRSLTNVVELLLQSTNGWVGAVREINVENYAVRLEDMAAARPVRLDLDEIKINVRNVSNQPGTNLTAAVSLRWNTNGLVKTETSLSLFPIEAQTEVTLERIDIRALDPYLDPFFNLLITDGRVGLRGRMNLKAVSNAVPAVSFAGDLRIDDFSSVDGVVAEQFVNWKGLRFSGIEARLDPLEATIKEIAVDKAYARLVVTGSKTNNLSAVLRMGVATNPPAPATAPGSPWAEDATAKTPPLKVSIATNAVLPSALAKVAVGTVVLSNVHLDFVDRSLNPPVSLSVQQVSGTVTGLSSEESARAEVNLVGLVDNTAPMEISGKINPLSGNRFTDLRIKFRGIELTPTSPYAGKFAGYRLTKGKLSLDLHYQLAQGKVKGANRLTIDQLTLGEKVESLAATKLPVRLAIAVLKDRSGKIELDVPVEGSLQDPEFKLGRVITRTLLTIITRVATSPFAALGAVFGGKGEEVSFQDFAPGSAELDESNRQKLDQVAKGLFERPGLQLEIEGGIDLVNDRDALRRQKLMTQFRTMKWQSLRKSERARLTPDQIALTTQEYAELLKASADATATRSGTAGQSPVNAAPVSVNGERTSVSVVKGAAALMLPVKSARSKIPQPDLEQAVLEGIEISERDFGVLADDRARKVMDYILQTGKVGAERVFLATSREGAERGKGSRVYLHLR